MPFYALILVLTVLFWLPLIQIPTVPTGISSGTKKDLQNLSNNDNIAFPNDPSNEARSLALLQKIGAIKMKTNIAPTKYTLADIAENPKNLKFTEMKGGTIPGVRTDFDFIILRGSDAYNGKIDFTTALAAEKQDAILPEHMMCLVVNSKNEKETWVNDIVDAYKSQEFKKYMSTQGQFWISPDYLQK